jgi:hypothetical protein
MHRLIWVLLIITSMFLAYAFLVPPELGLQLQQTQDDDDK